MQTRRGVSLACLYSLALVASASARPPTQPHEYSEPDADVDIVGDVDGTHPAPQKAVQDTIWIADWTFDLPNFACTSAGWERVDNHIRNDGNVYWYVTPNYGGTGGIVGQAAAMGYVNNVCCENPNGYDNDWYQGIRITYTGAATLSFDAAIDSEAGYDFLKVESDSACASFDRVNFVTAPSRPAARYRTVTAVADSFDTDVTVTNWSLRNFGPGTHCAYISFFSDDGFSPCDGSWPSTLGAGLVVDNIVISDASGTRTEDFEDGTLDIGTFVNMQDSKPFGLWGRTYMHITDNDFCTENRTCAWLWTDHTTPSLTNDPSQSFGPGGFVVHNWLDEVLISPWVSLASTASATATIVQFRRFPGAFFSTSRVVAQWSIRSRREAMGTACVSPWGHAFQWNSLNTFRWLTLTFDATPYFDPTAADVQVRHRVSDWQWIVGGAPPVGYIPCPGPYMDRTRIGRRILTGPVLSEGVDARSQAQDCFPTEIHPGVTPAGEHHRPTTDRFGTAAFSSGTELGANNGSPNIITQQLQGYNLIIYDEGNGAPGILMPDGERLDDAKVGQATFFRNWLAQASASEAGFATLWIVGSNAVQEQALNALFTTDCGVSLAATNQGLDINPDCEGQTSFTFDQGGGSVTKSFTIGERAEYSLQGGCPVLRDYDGLATSSSGVRVYRYKDPDTGALGSGAVVMNSNAAGDWNTVCQSHPLFDVRRHDASSILADPTGDYVRTILQGALPQACQQPPNQADLPGGDSLEAPRHTVLHQNFPNPFNPMTTLRFDLAREGRVGLRIYDVAGRLVRTLIDAKMTAGASKSVVWNGLDDAGRKASTGVYFYRLDTNEVSMTRKMLLMN